MLGEHGDSLDLRIQLHGYSYTSVLTEYLIESSLKRHGYYCRSRKAEPTSRSRSCASCAKARVRCDVKLPQCSRCVSRGMKCQYPARKSRNYNNVVEEQVEDTVEQPGTANDRATFGPSESFVLSREMLIVTNLIYPNFQVTHSYCRTHSSMILVGISIGATLTSIWRCLTC